MTNLNPVFIIPIYKEPSLFTSQEKTSLINNLVKLSRYKVILLSHHKLESVIVDFLACSIDIALQEGLEIMYIASHHLSSVSSYDRLLKSSKFYQIFSSFSHLVIVQLDVWIFGTNIETWLALPYAQIGAPWLCLKEEELSMIGVGNGGLSIRNIRTVIRLLESSRSALTFDSIRRGLCLMYGIDQDAIGPSHSLKALSKVNILLTLINLFPMLRSKHIFKRVFLEDYYLACLAESNPDITPSLPSLDEAASFSFESFPSELYARFGRLPFGCHAFEKHERSFWKRHIEGLK